MNLIPFLTDAPAQTGEASGPMKTGLPASWPQIQ